MNVNYGLWVKKINDKQKRSKSSVQKTVEDYLGNRFINEEMLNCVHEKKTTRKAVHMKHYMKKNGQ